MSLRPSMARLVNKLRQMVGDLALPQVWTDAQLQDALDVRRTVVRYAPLRPEPTPAPFSGIMQYLDYYGTCGYWEDDAQLFGPAWQPLTPATADLLTGHWTFTASQIPTVWVVGKYYDLFGVAADVLEMWAGMLKEDFDFQTKDTRLMRSQKMAQCLALAARYREQQEPVSISVCRSDMSFY